MIQTLAVSFHKDNAESECTAAMIELGQQLGKLLSIPSNPKLDKEWVDEMKNKWVRNLSKYGANVKTKKGRLSTKVFIQVIKEGISVNTVMTGVNMVFEGKEYVKLKKRKLADVLAEVDNLVLAAQEVLAISLPRIYEDRIANDRDIADKLFHVVMLHRS